MGRVNFCVILLFLVSVVSMSSCSKDGDEEGTQAVIDIFNDEAQDLSEVLPDTDDDTTPPSVSDSFTRDEFLLRFQANDPIYLKPLNERIALFAGDKDYFFDIVSGKCFNLNGEVERGDSNFLECNTPENIEVRNDEFSNYNFLGADARGVSVADAEVSLYDLVFAEVKFNRESTLNIGSKPFLNLFKNNKRIYFKQKRAQAKYSKAIAKYKKRKFVMKRIIKIFKSEKLRDRVESIIEKYNRKIALLKINQKIAKKKSRRHYREMRWISNVPEIVNYREEFSSRNKNSINFDGETAFSYRPSNEVINTDRFSISLWFKTTLDQGDKRLFNLHRGSSPGSALNLSLKHGRVVMGLHNGERYISNEVEFIYDDGLWHNFIVTKKKDLFTVYIDGIKSLEYSGNFSGFGSFSSMIGSYNGQGYYFNGDIDEISIWKNSLGKREIKNIYNSGAPTNLRLLPSSVYLSSWWRMGDHRKDSDKTQYNLVSKTEAILVE
ncbi:LamG domain-containing protein [Halobacteriovorax sp.]|uniref:LamG domain-containing protein n=1 Tax=Halobacteriovorax sp. TaxID=2020862 RepID=UPI003567EA8F